MPDAAYYRAWRAAHPEYRERQSALRKARRERLGRESRTTEYLHRASRATPPLPDLHADKVYAAAKAYVRGITPMKSLKSMEEWDREDAISEAMLAQLEGRNPGEAAVEYIYSERQHRYHQAPLADE